MEVEDGCVEFASGGGAFEEEAVGATDLVVHLGESGVVRVGVE